MKGRGTRWGLLMVTALLLALLGPSTALAQAPGGGDEPYEDVYEDQGAYDADTKAFGIGAGIVQPDGEGEVYFSANFRWRVGHDGRRDRSSRGEAYSQDAYNERYNRQHYRGGYPGAGEGIRAYLEPEIGYWSRSESEGRRDEEDILLGLNLVGVVPTRAADFFLGVGFGVHFVDGERLTSDGQGGLISEDLGDTRLGGNLQVGVEVSLSQSVGLFGTGRLDILEDQPNDRQTKIWGGLRFHF